MHASSMTTLSAIDQDFIKKVWTHYDENKRDLAWRSLSSDVRLRIYQVVVSEVMLQQTQVKRVEKKYTEWMSAFPDLESAASAQLIDILSVWSGLGYNRRARFLLESLKILNAIDNLENYREFHLLPGIGPNTSAAICAYAFNEPTSYVETNIRSAIIEHYFRDTHHKVSDAEILSVVTRIVDTERPREWYWALMDYGSYLKKSVRNNDRAKTYKKQSRFHGSVRQLRGKVLKLLLSSPMSLGDIEAQLNDQRTNLVLSELCAESLITAQNGVYRISS